VCIPSTFFIGDGGVPLEVTAGHLEADALVDKIETVIQVCHSTNQESLNVDSVGDCVKSIDLFLCFPCMFGY